MNSVTIGRSCTSKLDLLPPEIRLNIFELLYADLISELSDNLFGVFQIYDCLYDYTASHLVSRVGKTHLSDILHVSRGIHNEALRVLCDQSEFVVNLVGRDDSDDQERAAFRFSQGSKHLSFVRNLKVNVEPHSNSTADRFVGRISAFLDAIGHGAILRSLEIRISAGDSEKVSSRSMDRILGALQALRTNGRRIKVYLGDVTEGQLSNERFGLFLKSLAGAWSDMGRNHPELEPKHWEEEEDDDDL
ncbi:hypothetical protein F5Y15DRAFT_105728 [Xylariaceae sp. FL0016]|nr:hypothetical protein F5Y15DRAFT_105728 [Xylariaceae sp. FL0016]